MDIDNICNHITAGGTLPNLCKLKETNYITTVEQIYANPAHKQKYEQALQARGEWFIQTILNELKNIATADLRDAYDQNGSLLPPKDWPESLASCIQAVEVQEDFEGQGANRKQVGTTKRIKLWDKLKSLELLGKNLKMFKEQVEHTGTLTLEELVMGSMASPAPPPAALPGTAEDTPAQAQTKKTLPKGEASPPKEHEAIDA